MSHFDEQPDGDIHGECEMEIHSLQAQLAERDKEIGELHYILHLRDKALLEQQAISRKLYGILAWEMDSAKSNELQINMGDTSALESALKGERIKTLEEASENTCLWLDCRYELKRMAAELKDGEWTLSNS